MHILTTNSAIFARVIQFTIQLSVPYLDLLNDAKTKSQLLTEWMNVINYFVIARINFPFTMI